jgi:hypothetical protein
MPIVHYVHRPKRARKRKHPVAIPARIVTARKPGLAAPAIGEAITERRSAQPAAIGVPQLVTVKKPRGRFGDVPDMTAEEHQRRGDAAEALFRELARRAREE